MNSVCMLFSVATKSAVSLGIAFVCLFLSATAAAESSVWRVEKDGAHLYLGGTLHLLTASDFPLPEEFDRAYAEASTVYFETDIGAMNSPPVVKKNLAAMSYADGRTLKSVVTPETYEKLTAYFSKKGAPITAFDRFKAGGVSMMITVFELQSLGYTTVGVDQHYYDKAAADEKSLGFFETIDEQLAFIQDLGEGIEDEILLSSLADVANMEKLFDQMKAAWRTGDMEALYTLMVDELQEEFPDVYNSLLIERNNSWLPEIKTMLDTKDVEFVLVGAGHMAGAGGLLKQLEKAGYTVTQL